MSVCACAENALLAAATEHAVASGLGRGEFGAMSSSCQAFGGISAGLKESSRLCAGGYFNNLRALNQTFVPMSKQDSFSTSALYSLPSHLPKSVSFTANR